MSTHTLPTRSRKSSGNSGYGMRWNQQIFTVPTAPRDYVVSPASMLTIAPVM